MFRHVSRFLFLIASLSVPLAPRLFAAQTAHADSDSSSSRSATAPGLKSESSWQETIIYNFTGVNGDGVGPDARLIMDGSGNLYGTTISGGSAKGGTVFKLNPKTGQETVLHSFAGASHGDGARPDAGLVIDREGNLLGTTLEGGLNGSGTIFKVNPNTGEERVLYHFTGTGGDGASPKASLVIDSSGKLFGTTTYGGTNKLGTVFMLDPGTGQETVLYSFTGTDKGDGAKPRTGLVQDGSGAFYGTTSVGGSQDCGTIFRLDPRTGKQTTIHSFTCANGDGYDPEGSLVVDPEGDLYGSIVAGVQNDNGALFKLDSGTGNVTILHRFAGSGNGDGAHPVGDLVMDSTGNLYGTTVGGGSYNSGTEFKLNPKTGEVTVLRSLNGGSDGKYPDASLIIDRSGNLYGATSAGGPGNGGTVFKLSPVSSPALAQKTDDRSTVTSTEAHVATPQCISFNNVTSQLTPADLYPMAGQCIQDNDYADALAFFALAGMDNRYDRSRVNDKSTGDIRKALVMRTFQPLPAAARKRFGDVINAVSADKSATEYLCRRIQEIGPPAYYPEYMIMHGMNTVTAGLTKTPVPQELMAVADPSGTWKAIVTSYLHCSLAEKSDFLQDAQAADEYRKTVAGAIAISQAESEGQPIQASHVTATPSSAPSPSTNGDRATSAQQSPIYGPLTFNSEGADFYFAQGGTFAPASVTDGTIEIHLHPGNFQIGYNGEQMNICLAPIPFSEVKPDPSGYKASCLSGAMSGARAPNSDALLVYSGSKWSDGNSELTDATSMKAAPMKGFKFAYQVNRLQFVAAPEMTLNGFKGTLYGYIAVYKQHERSNKDVMPIHLILE